MLFKLFKYALLVVVIFLGVVIWGIVDWHSQRHWIGVYPITDASLQKEGVVEFILPSKDYVIVVSRDDNKLDDKLVISYELDIPQEGIKIQKDKEVVFSLANHILMETVEIHKNMAKGILRVKVLSPSERKVSVGLVTDRFGGM